MTESNLRQTIEEKVQGDDAAALRFFAAIIECRKCKNRPAMKNSPSTIGG